MARFTSEQLTRAMSSDVKILNPDIVDDLQSESRASKYGNVPTEVDGHRFASKKEARDYVALDIMRRAGQIIDLELQPRFVLQDAYTADDGTKVRSVVYVADFMWKDARTGRTHVLDSKGFKNAVYRVKEKLFRAKYPHIVFEAR